MKERRYRYQVFLINKMLCNSIRSDSLILEYSDINIYNPIFQTYVAYYLYVNYEGKSFKSSYYKHLKDAINYSLSNIRNKSFNDKEEEYIDSLFGYIILDEFENEYISKINVRKRYQ